MIGRTILVVEDDKALRVGICRALAMAGYRPLSASNGEEALAIVQETRLDLIISDIMMPQMNGHEFRHALQENPEFSSIPFIFLTARGERDDVRRGLREGVDAYLVKPFDLDDLLLHVENRLLRFDQIRKQTLAQLEDLQHQVVSMFSHELRTPLTYIEGYTDLLASASRQADRKEMMSMLEGIRAGSLRLNRLVNDFQTLMRLDSGACQREFIKFAELDHSPERIVDAIVERHHPAAQRKGQALVCSISEASSPVWHIEDYTMQAASKLVENAIAYSDFDSQIELRTQEIGNKWCFQVIDPGRGIDETDLETVFERFRQIDRDRYEQGGIGVGLAIARGIMRVQGGDVEVASDLGKGSLFTLWLPFADQTAEID